MFLSSLVSVSTYVHKHVHHFFDSNYRKIFVKFVLKVTGEVVKYKVHDMQDKKTDTDMKYQYLYVTTARLSYNNVSMNSL